MTSTERQSALTRVREVSHTETSQAWVKFLEAEIVAASDVMTTTDDDHAMYRHQGAVRKLRNMLRRVQA
jgi:hypothetical protein